MRALLLMTLPCCALTSMTRSPYRDTVPSTLQVDGVVLAATGAVNLYVFAMLDHVDFVPASFHIRGAFRHIYIDPVLVDDEEPADVIFVTHDHMDHLSIPDLEKLVDDETVIVCPREVAAELGALRHRVVAPDQSGEVDKIRYETTAAYNTRAAFLGMKAHAEDDENVGFVIEVSGVRIFYPGDTDLLPEMKELYDIDVVLAPIAGGDVAMSTKEAAELVNALRPRFVVPTHYPLETSDLEEFRKLVEPEIEVRVLQSSRPPPVTP